MKKHIATVLLCVIASTAVQADEIWVNGVSKENGWHDANKTHDDDSTGTGAQTDDNMCYAAAAANVLAWWQNQFIIPDTVPQGVDNIWQTFVRHSTDGGGGPFPYAIEWWLTGKISSTAYSNLLTPHDGYFSQYTTGQTIYIPAETDNFVCKINNPTTAEIIAAMSSGKAITLTVQVPSSGSHSITLWGIEHNNGVISNFWVTDSDDYTMKPELLAAAAGGTDGAYTLKLGEDDCNITAAFTIDPSVSEQWGMEKKSSDGTVPEPTTVTLSLLALAALCARRRRQ